MRERGGEREVNFNYHFVPMDSPKLFTACLESIYIYIYVVRMDVESDKMWQKMTRRKDKD